MAPVDIDALQSIIDKAVDAKGLGAFKLEDYAKRKVTQAVSAKGVHFNLEYVKDFYKISDGEILAGQLKQCILKYAHSHNTSEWKDDLWAGKIASQLVCLLSHVRRLRRDPAKRRQCMQAATGEQRKAIEEVVSLQGACEKATLPLQGSLGNFGDQQACNKAKKAKKSKRSSSVSVSSSTPSQACKKAKTSQNVSSSAASGGACKKARILKPALSEVTVDSEGFPAMLASPKAFVDPQPAEHDRQAMSILEKRRASYRGQLEKAAKAAAKEFVEKQTLERKRALAKRPASKEVARKKPAASSRPAGRQPSTGSQEEMEEAACARSERRPWSAVKKVLGQKQSYLLGLFGDKWQLIIACTEKQGKFFPGGHHSVVLELEKVVMGDHMTKEKMKEHRDHLVQVVD